MTFFLVRRFSKLRINLLFFLYNDLLGRNKFCEALEGTTYDFFGTLILSFPTKIVIRPLVYRNGSELEVFLKMKGYAYDVLSTV